MVTSKALPGGVVLDDDPLDAPWIHGGPARH